MIKAEDVRGNGVVEMRGPGRRHVGLLGEKTIKAGRVIHGVASDSTSASLCHYHQYQCCNSTFGLTTTSSHPTNQNLMTQTFQVLHKIIFFKVNFTNLPKVSNKYNYLSSSFINSTNLFLGILCFKCLDYEHLISKIYIFFKKTTVLLITKFNF